MNDKKVIGVKSYKFIILISIGFIVGLILSIIFLYEYSVLFRGITLIFGILSIICTLYAGYILIKAFVKPKNIVEVDDKGVYLNYSKNRVIYILFRDIENVFGDSMSTSKVNYKFGTLHLQAKNKRFKIGVVKNILETEKYIYSKIAWKFAH